MVLIHLVAELPPFYQVLQNSVLKLNIILEKKCSLRTFKVEIQLSAKTRQNAKFVNLYLNSPLWEKTPLKSEILTFKKSCQEQ